jgi:hypothetical protein
MRLNDYEKWIDESFPLYLEEEKFEEILRN